VSPPVLKLSPAKVEVAVVEAEIPERNPLNVEVEFVPSTFRNPCRVEVPPVKAWMVEVEVRPTYRASRAAIPLPIKSPVKVEVPKERDGAVTERNPAKVEVAPRLVTERLVRVVVPAERVEDKVVAPALDKEPKLADCGEKIGGTCGPGKACGGSGVGGGAIESGEVGKGGRSVGNETIVEVPGKVCGVGGACGVELGSTDCGLGEVGVACASCTAGPRCG